MIDIGKFQKDRFKDKKNKKFAAIYKFHSSFIHLMSNF